ncbi:MAG: ComEC/Rec2 family competence protein [Lachnospiraceae bacterium]|nr:ComEC/Rec2 family competence protein [Lachnospiraceae bacterium]
MTAIILALGIIWMIKREQADPAFRILPVPAVRLSMEQAEEARRAGGFTGTVRRVSVREDRYVLEADGGAGYGIVRVSVRSVSLPAYPGDTVRFTGSFYLFSEALNPGAFDARQYYDASGIFLGFTADEASVVRSPAFSFRRLAFRCYLFARARMLRDAFPEDSGVFFALFTGDTSLAEDADADRAKDLGLSWFFSSTGFTLSVIGRSLYELLRGKTGKPVLSGALATGVLAFYALMAGFPVGAWRALVLLAVRIGADLCGRVYDTLNGSAVFFILLLVTNPFSVCLPAVQYYAAILAGTGVLAPCILKFLFRRDLLFSRLVQGLSVQACLLPVQLLNQYFVSPYAPLLGLLLMPVRMLFWGTAFAGLLAGCAAEPLGKAVFTAGHLLLEGERGLLSFVSGLPFSKVVNGSPDLSRVFLYLGLLAAVAGLYRGLHVYRKYRDERAEYPVGGADFGIAACLLASALLSGTAFLKADLLFPDTMEILMLDVGQGDCFLVRLPEGETYLVDCGSSTTAHTGTGILIPALYYYGISSLDAVFLTHADRDHTEGALELLSEDSVEIGRICLPARGQYQELFSEIVPAAAARGIPVTTLLKGQSLVRDGPEGNRVEFRVLWPGSPSVRDENDGSLVFSLTFGRVRAVFTGDIGADVERVLRAGPADFLKVAHHGSKYSSSEAFLEDVRPAVAAVSYGKDNVYGHPAEETVARILGSGAALYGTGGMGCVIFRFSKNGADSVRCLAKQRIFW